MTNQDETNQTELTQFSQEELDEARAAIAALAPEEFLFLQGQLAQMQEALRKIPLGEASCIMWINLESPSGDQVNFTMRGHIPEDVADNFVRGLRYNARQYNLLPRNKRMQATKTGPVKPASQPAQVPPVKAQPHNVPVSDSTDPGATPDQDGHVPGQRLQIEIARISITPLAGEKAKITFYPFLNNGSVGNWEITNKDKPISEWVQDFANVGGYDFSVVAQYDFGQGQLTGEFIVSPNKKKTGRYYLNYARLLA